MPFNSDYITQILIQVIAPILLICIGLGILARARRANYGEVMQVSFNAIIGIVFIVGAATLMVIGGKIADGLGGGG